MSFEDDIRKWLVLDTRIKNSNLQLRELREQRSTLNDKIEHYVEQNNLHSSIIKTNTESIKFSKTKIQKPLTLKYIETCLSDIIHDPVSKKKIMDHIKNKREFVVSHDIKRSSK